MIDRIEAIVCGIAEELNENLEHRIPVELVAAAPLYGKEGVLDSLSLVSLIVAVEQAIEDEFEVSITLASDRAVSQKSSPFLTIGSLSRYADVLIKEAR